MIIRISFACIVLLFGGISDTFAQVDSSAQRNITICAELGPNAYGATGFDYGLTVTESFGIIAACLDVVASTRVPNFNHFSGEGGEWDVWDAVDGYELLVCARIQFSNIFYATCGGGESFISDATEYTGSYPSQQYANPIYVAKSTSIFMVGIGCVIPLSRIVMLPVDLRLLFSNDPSTLPPHTEGPIGLTEIGLGLRTGLGIRF